VKSRDQIHNVRNGRRELMWGEASNRRFNLAVNMKKKSTHSLTET
jgi:hypothetical protein